MDLGATDRMGQAASCLSKNPYGRHAAGNEKVHEGAERAN